MTDPVRAAHRAFGDWLFTTALPFWATAGCDGDLGAHEHLRRDGTPGLPGFKRLRVQARQIVVFSQAALLGWSPGTAPARRIHDFIGRHAETALWPRRLDRSGAALDATADLYDLAFVLLALAWVARLTGEAAPLASADRLLEQLDATMAHPAGGYVDSLPRAPGWRQQNPHMHLLEAMLALHETRPAATTARRAEALVDLFRTRLLDRRTATLGENFDEDWSAAPGEAGDHVEPGHQYEWVWLLSEADRLLGTDTRAERAMLYGFCRRHGIDAETGLMFDALSRGGGLRRGSARLWVQTEALRAHAVMGEPAEIPRIVDNLLGRYFAHPVAGAWTDQLDGRFRPASDQVPASSLYHIVTGYAALDRLVGQSGPSPFSPLSTGGKGAEWQAAEV